MHPLGNEPDLGRPTPTASHQDALATLGPVNGLAMDREHPVLARTPNPEDLAAFSPPPGVPSTPQVGSSPSRVNEHGCHVFRDEQAKHKLVEWGYPWMGGSRYPFDENLKGWEQFDTPQDASYYGIWSSTERKAVVSYTEGDVTLVVAPDEKSFQAEVRGLWDWNYNYQPDSGVHTQMDSPKLHAVLGGHAPFDQVLTEYKQRVVLGQQYEALHQRAHARLEDPSLSGGQFHVRSTDEHVFYLRGWTSSPRDICVSRKDGYNLNYPDHVLSPTSGANAAELARQIQMLEEFVGTGLKAPEGWRPAQGNVYGDDPFNKWGNEPHHSVFERKMGGNGSPIYELTILSEGDQFLPAHGGVIMPHRVGTAEEAARIAMDWYKRNGEI